jgi:hypothetical protein
VQLLVAGDATTAGASVSIRRRYAYQGLRLGAIATEGHSEPFLPSDPSKCKSMASNTSRQEAPFSPLFSPLRARIPVLSGVAARRRPNLKVVAEPAEPRATLPSRRCWSCVLRCHRAAERSRGPRCRRAAAAPRLARRANQLALASGGARPGEELRDRVPRPTARGGRWPAAGPALCSWRREVFICHGDFSFS